MGQTIIAAKVTDQALQLTNYPKLASGGIKEIKVIFTFCDLWADASRMVAVFYRDKANVYHVGLTDNAAVAPWEPFAAEGAAYMGVFAEYADGTTRTTEVVELQIAQGAITMGTAPSEAPDIYAALSARVEALENQVRALAGVSITEVADGTVTMVNTLSDGEKETIEIGADADGKPNSLTYNGVDIDFEWKVETTEENTAVEGETA